MRFLVLALLPFLAGCVCDAPVERFDANGAPHVRKVALGIAPKPHAIVETRRPSASTILRTVRVKRCDCPEDFDPKICGRRSAYTWAPDCHAPSTGRAKMIVPVPTSLKASTPP
ncbi:MAG: hypothetical protein JSR99_19640 [Proteobacteria bacterium]|nr:hypothetical protein [Pseudomonadota bacterium]